MTFPYDHSKRLLTAAMVCLTWLGSISTLRADFAGPSRQMAAGSPDGSVVVRVKQIEAAGKLTPKPKCLFTFYEYDSSADVYKSTSSFEAQCSSWQLLFVSNAGDLVLVNLSDREAICLYSKAGKLVKSWDLNRFLTKAEIEACGLTGSTLQWFEDGTFAGDVFQFCGPSTNIKSLHPPYSVMRSPDKSVSFFGSVNLTTGALKKKK